MKGLLVGILIGAVLMGLIMPMASGAGNVGRKLAVEYMTLRLIKSSLVQIEAHEASFGDARHWHSWTLARIGIEFCDEAMAR